MIHRRPARDLDLRGRSQVAAIMMITGPVGLIFGGAVSKFLGWNIFLGALGLGLPLGLVMWLMAHLVVEASGRSAGSILGASGEGTPYQSELSREEALIAAGRHDEAIEALSYAATRHPGDPRPPRKLAELYRDELGDLEEAVAWLRRAAAVPGIPAEGERMLLREIVELCGERLGRPELAAPALARAAKLHEGDRLGHWARSELRRIRSPAPPPR